jgi:hypothetical protein
MVLSVHPHLDLEDFLKLFKRFFFCVLLVVDCPDIMARVSHIWMFLSMHPQYDLEAFPELKQRVFIVALHHVDCPDIIVRGGHVRRVAAE